MCAQVPESRHAKSTWHQGTHIRHSICQVRMYCFIPRGRPPHGCTIVSRNGFRLLMNPAFPGRQGPRQPLCRNPLDVPLVAPEMKQESLLISSESATPGRHNCRSDPGDKRNSGNQYWSSEPRAMLSANATIVERYCPTNKHASTHAPCPSAVGRRSSGLVERRHVGRRRVPSCV